MRFPVIFSKSLLLRFHVKAPHNLLRAPTKSLMSSLITCLVEAMFWRKDFLEMFVKSGSWFHIL